MTVRFPRPCRVLVWVPFGRRGRAAPPGCPGVSSHSRAGQAKLPFLPGHLLKGYRHDRTDVFSKLLHTSPSPHHLFTS